MSRTTGRRRDMKSEINIVPFLDVLLVLLLIFMATAPVINQSVEVDLPQATEAKTVAGNDTPTVIVEVKGQGLYSLVIDRARMDALPAERVVEEAKRRLDVDPKTLFLIAGDKAVPYDEVIKALNLLRQAGIKSVGLMTQSLN